MNIPQMKTEEWLETLEPFQQNLIKTLLIEHTEEEVMEIWINVSGPEHTATFGGNGKKDYLKTFKEEFDKFVLGDEKYKDKIKELNEHIMVGKFFIVSFLSQVLMEPLGVAAGVIAPLIVLALSVIGKIGLNAYRNSIQDQRNNNKNL